jgi:7,8-dihydropterin-6-yl-methyl-4-(beta-D-ribofuranosyl)aminobenzene 5'-phosphate synthase
MMKLTVITENTVPGKFDGLCGEHGFSLFLETPQTRILFDTGPAGIATLNNAPKLGVDLRSADAIVISHGHGDHTGGLLGVLRHIGRPIPIYAHPGIFGDRVSKRASGKIVYAGMPYKREALEGLGATFDLSADFREIAPGIYLTGQVPRRSAFETGDAELFVARGGDLIRDPLPDDQSMAVKTSEGIALILGCCHAGLINTIEHCREQLPGQPIHTIIGGTHLGFAPAEQLKETSRILRDLGIKRLGLSHCTGLPAGAYLAREFGDIVAFCNVGYTLTLS